jgi:hypothetical protein
MTNEQIEELAVAIAAKVPTLIGEIQSPIRDAAVALLEETQESEGTKPILNIGITCKVNLATNPPRFALKAGMAVRRTSECDSQLKDPTQPELI